ncbi:Regulatory protein abaA [Madurella mycetomatis]|uniref:Regulatory protein abaA n=1 Tax=Madurella mycetomatis TaxID=100816 RepID=A0A175WB25_9PEZI|nr:Regulatory protein abaA [Madurella mycetomatis]
MDLPARLPILPSQCYPQSLDHGPEGYHGVPPSRKPLRESTGNAQHPHMAWFAQHLDTLSSMPPSIPTPPVLRTQSLVPEYGALPYTKLQRRQESDVHGRGRPQGANPLMPLLPQSFQNYRKKQEDKPDQKWPEVLEGHFIDALLLIPQMRRKKYNMKQTQYGRNMLIGEYLWIAYCQTLPPGAEPETDRSIHRKKVSSHIQVLKNFFSNHRCFHFFFGQRQEDGDDDDVETVSLKTNPILIALSEGRLPVERPNYEYFAQILALNEQVVVRPKRCWIFVSHQDVVVGEDGSGYLPATGDKLAESEYPHLVRNLERETWAKEEQQIFNGALLHEFTKEMHQDESSSVSKLSNKWETAFPELHQRLKAITSTTTDASCSTLHMQVTLELKEKRRFPTQSELNSWVEINIEQPRLLNHRWKVHTRLSRPAELSYSHDDAAPELLYETSAEIAIQYQHRPGCDGPRDGRSQCECILQRCRRDWVAVPFPAEVWALTLTNCAEYPAHPFSDIKKRDKERYPISRKGDEHGDRPASRRRSRQPTQMDLVPKIAMMQEIWSCPPGSPHERDQRWTRRALILWTFKTIHSIEDGKLVTAQGGKMNWRFLTILDPTSETHQRNAIVSGARASGDGYGADTAGLAPCTRPVSRDVVMSPNPAYQQHLRASMSENFSSTWDDASGLGSLGSSATQAAYSAHLMAQTTAPQATAVQAGYDLLDSLGSHSSLATPPPTVSLANSFAQGFDTTSNNTDLLPSYMANHVTVTTAGMDACPRSLGDNLAAVTDPFLSHVGTTYGATQDGILGWGSQGVSDSMGSAAAWSSAYSSGHDAHSHSSNGFWARSQPRLGRGNSEHTKVNLGAEQHYSQQKQQHRHHYPWASNGASEDEHGIWIPVTSATTPRETVISRAGSHSLAATQDRNQKWAHIQAGSATGESDVSQDWEEITALPGMGHSPSPPPAVSGIGSIPRGHEDIQIAVAATLLSGRSHNTLQSLKRSRSNSFDDSDAGRDCRRRRSE